MITRIKRFLSGLFNRKPSAPPTPPRDPYAFQPVSKKAGPNSRSGAVAVAEPDDGGEFAEEVGYAGN